MLKLEISFRGVLLIIAGLVTLWALVKLWSVLLLVVIAFILMLGLLPFVDTMVKRGLPRSPSVLLLLVTFLFILVGLSSLMIPAMVDEFQNIRDNLPDSARELERLLAHLGINVELEERARNIDYGGLISGQAAVDYGQRVASTTVALITVVAITVYLLIDTPRLARFAHQFIPVEREEEVDRLFRAVSGVVGGYLRGQLITSLIIGVYTFTVLKIVGIPNATAFAVLAGFADIIPLIGAFIAVIPPTAAAFQESSTQAVIVLASLLIYQQFEDRYLIPRVYGQTLNLPPIMVLIAVLAGADLLGITGVLLALPLTAAARVGLDYMMEKRMMPLMAAAPPEESAGEAFAPDGPEELPRRRAGG